MSTEDIQDYFETYDPHFSVEWVNDSTCEDGVGSSCSGVVLYCDVLCVTTISSIDS